MGHLFLRDSVHIFSHFIDSFYDMVMVCVVYVLSMVLFLMISFLLKTEFTRYFKQSELLEGIWTILPCCVLVGLAGPSLSTLYLCEEISEPFLSVKVVGHQWYWSYQYGDFNLEEYDSYMIPSQELSLGNLRLLTVDKTLALPLEKEIRVVVTSADVIHSWTVPSMGVKVDAIPGRLNQTSLIGSVMGKFYGQCSEICGINHSFMPICIELVSLSHFLTN